MSPRAVTGRSDLNAPCGELSSHSSFAFARVVSSKQRTVPPSISKVDTDAGARDGGVFSTRGRFDFEFELDFVEDFKAAAGETREEKEEEEEEEATGGEKDAEEAEDAAGTTRPPPVAAALLEIPGDCDFPRLPIVCTSPRMYAATDDLTTVAGAGTETGTDPGDLAQ